MVFSRKTPLGSLHFVSIFVCTADATGSTDAAADADSPPVAGAVVVDDNVLCFVLQKIIKEAFTKCGIDG